MRLEAVFEIFDALAGDFGIVEEGEALFVEGGGFFEMLEVETGGEIDLRMSYVCMSSHKICYYISIKRNSL